VKVAIFRKVMSANWNMDTIVQEANFEPDNIYGREYTQLTEWAEVEFVFLADEKVVGGQLKQIDAAEQALRNQFATKLQELAEARAKLQALTCETAS
jgi:hypothetical protein